MDMDGQDKVILQTETGFWVQKPCRSELSALSDLQDVYQAQPTRMFVVIAKDLGTGKPILPSGKTLVVMVMCTTDLAACISLRSLEVPDHITRP